MPLDPKRLRRWFAGAAILVIAISFGYYFYARIHVWRVAQGAPAAMGAQVQQSTQGFTLSKSEAGRTIFTVRASKAVQYKEGARSELHDVNILVYGRRSDRFDQIHGDDFEYDPNSGDIIAHGDVAIDLEGDVGGPVRPDQATPVELKNPVHLKTSGLIFNQKTGAAVTHDKIEFRVPQASGTAVGANYDSKSNTLTLDSQVHVEMLGGTTVLARHATIMQNPRRAVLDAARIERPTSDIDAGQLTIYLRDDNSISRLLATGEVRGTTRGPDSSLVEAAQGSFEVGPKNELQSGTLLGGVKFQQQGPSPLDGTAGRATLTFGSRNLLTGIKAADDVHFIHDQRATANRPAQLVELSSDTLDVVLTEGRLQRGLTGGAAKITVHSQPPSTSQGNTVITAGHFEMNFGAENRLRKLQGEPDAKIISSIPGQPDKVSTSRSLDVAFNPTAGTVENVVQKGTVHYQDGQRSASAEEARYTPADENLVLTGSPRWIEAGAVTTARLLKVNRRSGDAVADGEVKTTYREMRSQAGGPLMSGPEPIHITATSMTADRKTGIAIYSGSARLWQESNIVEAPIIEFDRSNRILKAKAARQPVSTVLLQDAGKAKATPVSISSSSLTYSDSQHRAVFDGNVLLRSTNGTVSADHAEVLLISSSTNTGAKGFGSTSKIQEIVAQGHVVLQQPSRKAVGNTMTYTAAEDKYVLTGGRPSIFDAERGLTTGDSLTFYSRNDTVLVGSESSTRTVTQTHTGK